MNHIMVDLETLGTAPGCSIVSIGAVYFGPAGLGEEFYSVVSRESCKAAGLHEDEDTLQWWERQSTEARVVLGIAESKAAPALGVALQAFTAFCRQQPNVYVWGNGADFDNPILACAFRAAGLPLGWRGFNGRCYRTLKKLVPNGPKLVRQGTHHNALDDAKSQAAHAIELFKASGLWWG